MKNCLSKKGKIIAVIIAVLLIICASGYIYSIYSENQKKEEERLDEGRDKRYIIKLINGVYLDKYKKPEYNDKYWKEFLEDPYTADALRYLNQYMNEVYPDSPFVEITVEDLNKNYSEIIDLWFGQLDEYLEMKTNGEYYFYQIAAIAIYEGEKRDVIDLLGYGELTENYIYNNITYRDIFLQEENLETFLEKLNQYMDSTYPEIEFEDITIDRLENEPYTDNKQFVCEQLKEVKKQLEAEGVNWETIVQQIHTQIE